MIRSLLRRARLVAAAGLLSTCLAVPAFAAPDFPPGSFSDGGKYKMADFEGKVLVLFFYESDCPRCRGEIPNRNKVVDQFKDKPVKFIAVAPGDTTIDAISYTKGTGLKMPAFSDIFGVMQARYGTSISLQNIWQFRIIGPKGDIIGSSFEPAAIEQALASVTWKYKDGGYHDGLKNVIEMLEWNQYESAIKSLKPLTRSGKKDLAESATKLWEAVTAEGKGWLEEANKLADSDPVKAYDLNKRVLSAFGPQDDLGKQADANLKTLANAKPVTDELAARVLYDGLSTATNKAQATQKPQFIKQAQAIARKYPETPTGKKAAELAGELEKAEVK